MAEVEEVSVLQPDVEKLRHAAGTLRPALDHLERSVDLAGVLSARAARFPEGLGAFLKPRLDNALQEETALATAFGTVHASLNSGVYPAMAACVESLKALDAIMSGFKLNASIHQAEGL